MTVFHVILPDLDEAETARYAGLRNGADFPNELIKAACRDAKILASAKASWQYYPYEAAVCQLHSSPPLQLQSSSIAAHLAGCSRVAVLALTIGALLEQQACELFAAGDYTAALLLEAAGTTAVETAADKVCALIAEQAGKEGLFTLPRFSPGYGDWDITVQPAIVSLAGGGDAGISVHESCMLLPRKSITAVIGLKSSATGQPSADNCKFTSCSRCSQPKCLSRKEQKNDFTI